ncbi:H-NS histone family protein [Burkholderia arboris]|uniref:H-NS histone family protein n=1 Tax=Burkholderia arboris TaxID=488730 RepID=UPI001CA43C39|nr:H-NS histone family protein [Burkholderia arboris]MBY8610624.1 H-NS histone family protein [Burkholderia arboris]
MKTYQEYIEYSESIKKELEQTRLKIAERVLREVRECVEEFGFNPEDVFSGRRKHFTKYYNPATGQTWSGRGREPLWIRGKDRKLFELNQAADDGAQDR